MGIIIGANFTLRNKKMLDDRQFFDTLTNMKAFPEISLPNGILTFCDESGKIYQYLNTNTDDEITGKWREFSSTSVSTQSGNMIEEKEDGIFVNSSKVDSINLYNKYVNTELEYGHFKLDASYTAVINTNIPFTPQDTNIEFDTSTKGIKLTAGKTYKIDASIFIGGASSYIDYILYNLTTSSEIGPPAEVFSSNYAANSSGNQLSEIYKPTEDCYVAIKIIAIKTSCTISPSYSVLNINEIARSISVDPIEYINTSAGIEDTPVGHILSYMGTTTPNHYLTCDGSIYNISDYTYLSEFIKENYGTYNFFGGDGITTFAVPDLRNEFIRGYHGDKESLSGDIGVHQDATTHITIAGRASISVAANPSEDNLTFQTNRDTVSNTLSKVKYCAATLGENKVNNYYTARPTNIAVLFCIKYEPTYCMTILGWFDENVLYEGVTTIPLTTSEVNKSITINLIDDYTNYDSLEFVVSAGDTKMHQIISLKSSEIGLNVDGYLYYETHNITRNGCSFKFTDSKTIFISFGSTTSSAYTSFVINKIIGVRSTTEQFENGIGDMTEVQCKSLIEEVWS